MKILHYKDGEALAQLPREVAYEVFKARLGGKLSNLVYWKLSLLMEGELEQDDRYAPSNHSLILWQNSCKTFSSNQTGKDIPYF